MANEGIELVICSYEDPLTPKWLLPNRIEPKALEELGGTGGGSFKIHRDDPRYVADPTMLDSRNVAKVKVDNKVIGAFLIGDKESILVNSSENKERGFSVSGEGLKTWFDDAEVYPMSGELQSYSRDTRSFNFASEQGTWYNPAAWINSFNYGAYNSGNAWSIFPEKWPAVGGSAAWIGPRTYSTTMPVGVWYARHEFTIVTSGKYVIYSAVDDYFDMYLDGQHIAATKEEGESWKSTARIELTLDAGPHILAYAAYNEGGPSAILMAMASIAADKTETLFTRSGVGTWKVLDFPAAVPGWSIGEILLKLLDEAESRGVLFPQWLTPTFTATTDSNGDPWPTALDWSFKVGESYASVISKFEDLVNIWIDPETLELNVATVRGENRTTAPYTAWTERRRNLIPNSSPTTYSGSGWAASTAAFNGDNTDEWVGFLHSGVYTAYVFTDGFEEALAIGDQVTLTVQYRVNAVNASQAATHMAVVPHRRTGNVYYQAGRVDTPITIGKIETVQIQWTVTEAVPIGDFDIALVSSNGTGPGFSTVGAGWDFQVRRPTIERGHVSGVPFTGDTEDTEFVQHSWLGATGTSLSVEEFRTTNPSNMVEFRLGKHLREARTRSKGKIKNALAIKSAGGWSEEVDTTSINKYGRIEGSMDTGASAELVPILSDIVFAQRANEEEGASYDIVSIEKKPFVDFGVGDWVLAPNDRGLMVPRRVMSISVTEGPSGNVLYTLEFDTIFRNNEQQMGKIIGKMGGGGVGGGMGNVAGSTPGVGGPIILPPDSTPAPIYPKAPTGLSGTSTGAWNPNGVDAISTIVLDWNDVTQNVDNTATVPQFYEIEGRETGTPTTGWQPFGRTSVSTITLPVFEPGDSWVFRVRALNPDGQSGAWSTEFTHVMVGPSAPMLAPTTPTVNVYKGIAQVSWDGNLSNGAPPPAQFRYVYAEHRVTAINGTPVAGSWVRNGNPLLRGSRVTFFTNIFKGWDFEVRFTAVDGVGIESAKSASSTVVTMTGVNLGELNNDVTDAITAAQDAADTAQSSANAAQIAADLADDKAEAAQTDADAAQTSANQAIADAATALSTANTAISTADAMITWSPNAPVVGDGTGKPVDAVWYRTSANGIIGQWRWTGSAWTSSPVDDSAIFSINAVKITAGTLDAARIAANSITAAKLLIGNLDNLIPDPNFANPTVSGWNSPSHQIITDGGRVAGKNALRIVGSGAQKGAYNLANIPVEAGDIFRLSVWVKSSIALGAVSNFLGPYFQIDRVGTTQTTGGQNNAVALTANTWTKIESFFTIPTDGYQVRAGFFAQAPLTTGATLDFTEPEMVRVSDATLIADGSIVTAKIAANAVTATQILAATITGDKIAAGTISTTKLLVTSLDNLVEDGSFEYSTVSGVAWTLTAGDTITATLPRTGARALQLASGTVRACALTVAAFKVEEGEQYRIQGWSRLAAAGTSVEGVTLRFKYGTTEASTPTASADIAISPDGEVTTTYGLISGVWTVPAGAKYARAEVVMRDNAAGRTYHVDDIAVFKMSSGQLIVDGAITTSKIAADQVSAIHLQAGSVATPHLQAQAVTSEKVAADSITANHIAVGAIEADAIAVGAVKTQHISPEVGGQLDISANDTVQIIAGRVDGVEADTNATAENLETMQTYYAFGPAGAVISSPGSAYSLALRNDIIEMLENGNPVSYWNSGTLYVNQFVGEKVSLGNHQLAKFEDGTVVRALGA